MRREPAVIELSRAMRVGYLVGGVLAVVFAGAIAWRNLDGVATAVFVGGAAAFLLLAFYSRSQE